MDYDHLSHNIRTKLSHYPTSIDTIQLRKKIADKRKQAADQKSKRKIILLWCCLLLLGIQALDFFKKNQEIGIPTKQLEACIDRTVLPEDFVSINQAKENFLPPQTSNLFLKKTRTKNVALTKEKTIQPIPLKSKKQLKAFSMPATPSIDTQNQQRGKTESSPFLAQAFIPKLATKLSALTIPTDYEVNFTKLSIVLDQKNKCHKKIKTSVSFFIAPEYALKKLSGQDEAYIQQRQQTESSLESFTYGILVHFPLKKGWTVATGLSYQKINEQLFWKDFSSALIQRDHQFYYQYWHREKVHFNSLHHLDLPLFLAYGKEKKHWIVGLQAGTFLNLIQKTKGEIIAPDLEHGHFIPMDGRVFKKRIAPTIAANFKLGYRLNTQLTVNMEPGFRFQTQSITVSDFQSKQGYAFVYIGFGLNWSLD